MRIDHPTVVAEDFDGEQVIINLATGMYYSLDHVGTVLWNALDSGSQYADLCRSLVTTESLTAEEAARTVDAFLVELVTEQLVVDAGDVEPPDEPPRRPVVLTRFSDLADVLLVDPIHDLDLDGDGWPIDAGSGVGRPPDSDAGG